MLSSAQERAPLLAVLPIVLFMAGLAVLLARQALLPGTDRPRERAGVNKGLLMKEG